MNLTKKQNARERFVNRICEAEKYLAEKECEEISFAVDVAYVQFLKPGFLTDDETASLHFKNGILVLVVVGGNGKTKERAVKGISPRIQMALNEPIEMMVKHCEQKLARACDVDATVASRETVTKRKPKEPSETTALKRYFESILPRRKTERKNREPEFESIIDDYIAAAELLLARLAPKRTSSLLCLQRVRGFCDEVLALSDILAIHYRDGELFLVVINKIDFCKPKSHLVSTLSAEMRVIVALTLPDLISQYDQVAGQKARTCMADISKALDSLLA